MVCIPITGSVKFFRVTNCSADLSSSISSLVVAAAIRFPDRLPAISSWKNWRVVSIEGFDGLKAVFFSQSVSAILLTYAPESVKASISGPVFESRSTKSTSFLRLRTIADDRGMQDLSVFSFLRSISFIFGAVIVIGGKWASPSYLLVVSIVNSWFSVLFFWGRSGTVLVCSSFQLQEQLLVGSNYMR